MHEKLVERYLEEEPLARERKNKNKAIGNLIIRLYGVNIPKDTMADIVGDILNGDRYWRKVTAQRPELQGSDYNTKTKVEQEYELALGYEPNYNQKLKLK